MTDAESQGSASGLMELLDQLTRLTEAQLQAAVALDPSTLVQLAEARGDLAFALRVEMSAIDTSRIDRPALRAAITHLRELEARLATVTGSVLGALHPLIPDATAGAYGRRGRISRY